MNTIAQEKHVGVYPLVFCKLVQVHVLAMNNVALEFDGRVLEGLPSAPIMLLAEYDTLASAD
jgi:hypothetical protein